ncbi:Putative aminotransferase class IV, branched-chain amino acid aminotransferase II [Septoria linicola]|uniref:Aminotransferase class IV, branched-chain amino acid aminotransferase II n=1 Tax=Septoria linicola TaxID=215465 RepID=A0A9Q9AYH6_9PEZI|nr:putative aminotransferase class IV, branched-chain amino acid aminotransferase II [Septoria linicola]USW57459.1 Putative aminotransferase class IV, branched-chain amino acid aminotransferase II [Septoria linicola]
MASTFPPPPVNTIVREVNGHVESTYSTKTGSWTAPKFIRDPFLRLHGMAPGLNYGMQCYEGLKASRFPNDTTIGIFRPQANAERMQHSASYVSMPDVPVELFNKAVHLAVSLNAAYVPPHRTGASMYIRPLLFGSSAQLGLDPPEEYTFCVYVMPTGVYHGVHPVDCLVLEDFDRAAPEGTGSAKIGGNYAPVLRHSGKAKKEGFGITLHLDSRTRTEVDEFSTSGFIGIHGDTSGDGPCTIVVPDSKNVIKSVTSNTICEIAKSWGWKVEQRPIKYDEISTFTEIAAAGTAAALVPIKSITCRSKNDKFSYQGGSDEPGPAVVKLLTQLKGIQQGKVKDEFGWVEKVREYKESEYEADGAGKAGGVNGESVSELP